MFGIVTSVRFDIGYPSGYEVHCWVFGNLTPNSEHGRDTILNLARKNIPNNDKFDQCFVVGYNII